MAVLACLALRPRAVPWNLGPAFHLGPKTEWHGLRGQAGLLSLCRPQLRRGSRDNPGYSRLPGGGGGGPFWNPVFVVTVATWTEARPPLPSWLVLTTCVRAQQGQIGGRSRGPSVCSGPVVPLPSCCPPLPITLVSLKRLHCRTGQQAAPFHLLPAPVKGLRTPRPPTRGHSGNGGLASAEPTGCKTCAFLKKSFISP